MGTLFSLSGILLFLSSLVRPDVPAPDKTLLLQLINQQRAKGCMCGDKRMPPAPALVWSDTMALAAQQHAQDMERRRFLSHTGSDSSRPQDRLSRLRYNWWLIGENIAQGTDHEASTIALWIKSPRHCQNLMGTQFRQMGIARSGNYWVQVLAQPATNRQQQE